MLCRAPARVNGGCQSSAESQLTPFPFLAPYAPINVRILYGGASLAIPRRRLEVGLRIHPIGIATQTYASGRGVRTGLRSQSWRRRGNLGPRRVVTRFRLRALAQHR